MLMSRRGFMLLSGSLIAAASTLAAAPFLSAEALSREDCQPVSPRTGFTIHGWDDVAIPTEVDDQFVIRLNHDWRASWH